jgi:hypothetical protein
MPNTNTRSRTPAVAVLLTLLLACIGLAACGGSSSKTSSSAANAASTSTSTGGSSSGASTSGTSTSGTGTTAPGGPIGHGAPRFAAIRTCLQKNGITLPTRRPGSHGPTPGVSRLGLPKGVTPKQYEAAVKKCGGGGFAGGGARFANNPVFKAALVKYSECLRQNGVDVPTPNTSGRGPVFDTKGINTRSPQFKAATAKCRGTLTGAFRSASGRLHPNGSGASGGSGSSG